MLELVSRFLKKKGGDLSETQKNQGSCSRPLCVPENGERNAQGQRDQCDERRTSSLDQSVDFDKADAYIGVVVFSRPGDFDVPVLFLTTAYPALRPATLGFDIDQMRSDFAGFLSGVNGKIKSVWIYAALFNNKIYKIKNYECGIDLTDDFNGKPLSASKSRGITLAEGKATLDCKSAENSTIPTKDVGSTCPTPASVKEN